MVTSKQRKAVLRHWEHSTPPSKEVINQFTQYTSYGIAVDYSKLSKDEHQKLDNLLHNHSLWPWIMRQERKNPSIFLPDIQSIPPGPCRDKWIKFKGWEKYFNGS